jgi:hypothetical protein
LVERLVTLYNVDDPRLSYAGISKILIAEYPGLRLGRDAVIGKIFRLKLPVRPRPPKAPPYQRKPRKLLPPLPNAPPTYIPRPQPPGKVTFEELGFCHCKWPSGERPNVTYCGRPRCEGRPYCPRHIRESYVPRRA